MAQNHQGVVCERGFVVGQRNSNTVVKYFLLVNEEVKRVVAGLREDCVVV